LQGEEQRGEVPVPIVKGDVKRATRPFEDKVKKVQKAPRLRPLLGPGSSRSPSPGGKGGKRQEIEREREREGVVKRRGRGSVMTDTREVCRWRSRPLAAAALLLLLLLLLAALPSTLHHRSLLSLPVFRGAAGGFVVVPARKGACLCVVDPSTGCR
jgi:hypothetical protein